MFDGIICFNLQGIYNMIDKKMYKTIKNQQSLQPQKRYKSIFQLYLINGNLAISSFYMGYIQIYLAAINIETIIEQYSIQIDKHVAQGLLNACIPLGAIFGGLTIQYILSKFSRRKSLLLINIIAFIVGLLIFIPNFYSLIFFRLIQGCCVGFYSGVPLLMIKQIAPIELSGTMGNLTQLFLNTGFIVAYQLTYILRKITGDQTCKQFWFIIFAAPLLLIAIQSFVLINVFPYETPKFLLMNNLPEQAEKLIKLIYKPQFVQQIRQEKLKDIQKINEHKQQIESATSSSYKIKVDQTSPPPASHQINPIVPQSNRKTKIAAVHIAIFLQMTGISVLNVYCGPMAQKKASGEMKILLPTLLNIVKLIGALIGSIIISYFNRKAIFQFGLSMLLLSNCLIFFGFHFNDSNLEDISMYFIIFGMFLYLGCFGGTIGPISWLYISEIVQPKMYSYAVAIVWAMAAFVVLVFPIVQQSILDGNPSLLFLFFALYSAFSIVINKYLLIETRNKTQKQILEDFQSLKICE